MDAIKIEPDSDGESSECKEQEEVPQPFTFVAVKEEMQEEDGNAVKGLLPNEEQDVLLPSACRTKTGAQCQLLPDKNYPDVKCSGALKLQDELKDRMMELQPDHQIIFEHNTDVIKVENYSNSNIEASLQGNATIEVKQKQEFDPFTSVAVKQELIEEDWDNTSIKEELNDELPTEEQNVRLERVDKRVHTGDRAYTCDVCSKTFLDKWSVLIHCRIHTGQKPYICEFCNKRFAESSNLSKHRRTHTGEKPFKCEVCKRGFTHVGHLVTHRRTHTGEKPYKCEFCEKCFSHSGSLTTHRRIHTGEKPYSCNNCNMSFSHRNSFILHRRKHEGN